MNCLSNKTWLTSIAPNHRKLGLIYLANEVVQQSRARKKEEFLSAFAPVCNEEQYLVLNANEVFRRSLDR